MRVFFSQAGRCIIQKNAVTRKQRLFSGFYEIGVYTCNGVRQRDTTFTLLRCTSSSAKNIEQRISATILETEHQRKLRIVKTLVFHVWPKTSDSSTLQEKREATKTKRLATISLGLMVAAKLVNIQVPYWFKALVDNLPSSSVENVIIATDTLTHQHMPPVILAMLLGYGISRATASGMQELRNTIFAHVSYTRKSISTTSYCFAWFVTYDIEFIVPRLYLLQVAQDAIRKVGRSVFEHIHSLDMQFHLARNTGCKSSIVATLCPFLLFITSFLNGLHYL